MWRFAELKGRGGAAEKLTLHRQLLEDLLE